MKHPDHPWALYINTSEFQCPEFDVTLRDTEMSCLVPAYPDQEWQFQMHLLGWENLQRDRPPPADKVYTVELWIDFKLADCFPITRGVGGKCMYGPHPEIIKGDVLSKTVPDISRFEIEFRIFGADGMLPFLKFRFILTEPILAKMMNCPTRERLPHYRRKDQLVVPASELPAKESFLGTVDIPYIPFGVPFTAFYAEPVFYPYFNEKKVGVELVEEVPEMAELETLGEVLDSATLVQSMKANNFVLAFTSGLDLEDELRVVEAV